MRDNRRDFIKKISYLTAAGSVAGITACTGPEKKSKNAAGPEISEPNGKDVDWSCNSWSKRNWIRSSQFTGKCSRHRTASVFKICLAI